MGADPVHKTNTLYRRSASARCAWAERPSAIRERGPWSRCRARALCPQGWLGCHECPGVRPAPTAAAVEASLVAIKEDKQTG